MQLAEYGQHGSARAAARPSGPGDTRPALGETGRFSPARRARRAAQSASALASNTSAGTRFSPSGAAPACRRECRLRPCAAAPGHRRLELRADLEQRESPRPRAALRAAAASRSGSSDGRMRVEIGGDRIVQQASIVAAAEQPRRMRAG